VLIVCLKESGSSFLTLVLFQRWFYRSPLRWKGIVWRWRLLRTKSGRFIQRPCGTDAAEWIV